MKLRGVEQRCGHQGRPTLFALSSCVQRRLVTSIRVASEVEIDKAESILVEEVSTSDVSNEVAHEVEAVSAEMLEQIIQREVQRRRNFAIISHPDAGKTTLTEKLLLYGGAIHEAGEVKARRAAKSATSDWMELEKQRGISITSTALTFEYSGIQINLLDTPGHQDFSEDTYRTLAAADNAVMLVDGAKGIEPQTRKLFQVARMRKVRVYSQSIDRECINPYSWASFLSAANLHSSE